jgi:hypothetical protein
MVMNISFDLEIVKPVPSNKCSECSGLDFSELDEGGDSLPKDHIRCIGCGDTGMRYDTRFASNWLDAAPLGISCAAASYQKDGKFTRKFWYNEDEAELAMTELQCVDMLLQLSEWQDAGHKIVTWNGLSFDFHVLAMESGQYELASRVAMAHADMMFHIVAKKGHRLGLDAALGGAGLASKLHEVTLTTGEVITEMSGAMAPELWQKGERQAVLDYLGVDVDQTAALANHISRTRKISWTSKAGRRNAVPVGLLPTVAECLEWPEPYVAWMDNPPKRSDFMSWMKGETQ